MSFARDGKAQGKLSAFRCVAADEGTTGSVQHLEGEQAGWRGVGRNGTGEEMKENNG